jgi:hypothetical protein
MHTLFSTSSAKAYQAALTFSSVILLFLPCLVPFFSSLPTLALAFVINFHNLFLPPVLEISSLTHPSSKHISSRISFFILSSSVFTVVAV